MYLGNMNFRLLKENLTKKIIRLSLLSAFMLTSSIADAQRVMPKFIVEGALKDDRWLEQFLQEHFRYHEDYL